MKTIQELKEQFVKEEARIMDEGFGLAAKARQVDISMDATVKERLGPEHFDHVVAAEGEAWAETERARLRQEYELAYEKYIASRDARVDEIEEALTPR